MRPGKVVVLCPSNVQTGGPEALHQLVDSVNRQGGDGSVLYVPKRLTVPHSYSEYRVRVANMVADDVLLVVPEIWPHKLDTARNTVLWWLSVDFSRPESLLASPGRHVTQSVYAQRFLAGHDIQSTMLTDYVHPVFRDLGGQRRNAVAVNPAKGAEWITRFKAVAPDIEVVELAGMSREQLVEVLNRVKVFVDFGHHPGRDRLPREAAMCGCTVFINHVGAGQFREDYDVEDWFRFSVDDMDLLVGKVREMFVDRAPQPFFVEQIMGQRDQFDAQVRELAW